MKTCKCLIFYGFISGGVSDLRKTDWSLIKPRMPFEKFFITAANRERESICYV